MTEDNLSVYLRALSETTPESTYQSHKNTLQYFAQYCKDKRVPRDELDVETAANFIIDTANKKSVSTLSGEIDVLGSYLAYLWESAPSTAVSQIKSAIRKCVNFQSRNQSVKNKLSPLWSNYSLDSQLKHQIESLIACLRRSEYGSRAHVLIELIIATSGRLSVLQKIDIQHIDREAQTISLQIPETHVIRTCNILQRRTVNLPTNTVDALETFIKYERFKPQLGQKQPLFTTQNGRASLGTLRRSIKEASRYTYMHRLSTSQNR